MYLLYIDPGTGSMLFAALVGIISTLFFFLQKFWLKIKFLLHGGRVKQDASAQKVPYVIFGEGGQYWTIFQPVCDELEARGIDCEYYTMDEKDPALESHYEHIHPSFIGSDNRAFAKLNMMKASVCLATTPGLDVLQWKRSKGVDKYIHIFHGVDEGTGYRMFGMDFYDSVLLSGQYQEYYIRKMEEMRGIARKDLPVIGSTYLDTLWDKAQDLKHEAKDAGAATPPSVTDRTILLAPSWGKSAILSRFGEEIIEALLATGYHIIVRPHPQTRKAEHDVLDPLMKKYPDSAQLEWDFSNDNFLTLSRGDVLISDFSSVVFDFALIFDKPVIFADTQLDTAPYDAAWFDGPVWRLQVLEELGISLDPKDFGRMKEIIDDLIASDHYQKGRDRLRGEVWQNQGHAAQGVVDYLVESLPGAAEPEGEESREEAQAAE